MKITFCGPLCRVMLHAIAISLISLLSECGTPNVGAPHDISAVTRGNQPALFEVDLTNFEPIGTCNGAFPLMATFRNLSTDRCDYVLSFGDYPGDFFVRQINPDGSEMKDGDRNALPQSPWQNTAGGSLTLASVPAHSACTNNIDLSKIFSFSRPGVYFVKVGITVKIHEKVIEVWSKAVRLTLKDG